MVSRLKFMGDLAQMANGAASAFSGVREEVDNIIRQQMERALNTHGLVTREEFDALRTRHEALVARLALLELTERPEAESQDKSTATAKELSKRKNATKKNSK